MLLRKTRKHLQGNSNLTRSQPHLPTYQPYSNTITIQQTYTTHPHRNNKQKQHISKTTFTNKPEESLLLPAEYKLKQKYQGKKNIKRIIEDWGIEAKGFITEQQFKKKIEQTTGINLTSEESQQLIKQYGVDKDKIDVKGLVTLLFNKTEGILFNQTLFDVRKVSQARQKKIEDLNENIKIYANTPEISKNITDHNLNQLMSKINTSISKLKQTNVKIERKNDFFEEIVAVNQYNSAQKTMLKQIREAINFEEVKYLIETHKNVDNLMLDPILRKVKLKNEVDIQSKDTKPKLFSTMSKSIDCFSKTLTSQQKRAPFNPLSLMNTDQRKTRFGKSNFTAESMPWFENTLNSSVTPNQKEQVLLTLKSEQQFKKIRYLNKLQKLRQWRRGEHENILFRESEGNLREEKRQAALGEQQQAYNYVNFIKKRWE